ncbi:tail assembly protein [Pseudomonas sp. PARCl1]|uniref:tail assembly protein n=1 Tax=Pseudomonas sp. PARCl1 TaxID=2853444 RepID=UPI001C77A471|nr:tail assembly protein [Pseudomonas sp. PARCl1]QXM18735.1 tail assembly protein [Pseudomonas phage PARCL1pr]
MAMVITESARVVRTVRLYGVLGARFGREFRLAVASPREAMRALCAQLPGLRQFLETSRERGLTYAVFVGRRNMPEAELDFGAGAADIRIAPVMAGSKKGGLFQVVLGAVLVGVGLMVPGGLGMGVMAAGAGMMMGGVVSMLAPQAEGLNAKEQAENTPSYAFGGAVTTVAQGNPVGLGYGRRLIGGALISGGIYAEDQM